MMVIAVAQQDCDRGDDGSRGTVKGPNDQTDNQVAPSAP